MKVLGLLAPRERMFHGTKVPRERKFSLWTFRSRERKCSGTKRPGFILFPPPAIGVILHEEVCQLLVKTRRQAH